MLELTDEQANFLYRLLDQVSVSGEENKAIIVEIMRAIRQDMQEAPQSPQNDAGARVEEDSDAPTSS